MPRSRHSLVRGGSVARAFATVFVLLAVLAATPLVAESGQGGVAITSQTFGGLSARAIGPAVTGGRIAAVTGVPGDPATLWVGAAGGGVWKSLNGGTTFNPVFDKHSQSIGAIAVDPEHHDTVWVGTGEPWTRNSVSVGTGVYKSTDGGSSWKMVGLADSEHI
ncbi:MAG TPA: hypothetical protein VKA53_03240, partial [Thermoanaerobaculia bacterium]|nr:hypothetical protein [Thermoanaerobaculia bacterium]